MEAIREKVEGAYFITTVGCPRCKVLALHHPKGDDSVIFCALCDFTAHTPEREVV